MTTLRPGRSVRYYKIPYTRKSKYKSKNYVKTSIVPKITQYQSGNVVRSFDTKILVVAKIDSITRDNALEAARIVANKYLTDTLSDLNFKLITVTYPHQILREHKLATGAGADRFSSGMQKSFGKPTGLAARIHAGDQVFQIHVQDVDIKQGKIAASKMGKKLGFKTMFIVTKNEKPLTAPVSA